MWTTSVTIRPCASPSRNGKWAQASRLSQPVNVGKDPKALIRGLSCTKAGYCLAVGSYSDTGGNTQAVVFSRSGGK